MSRMKTLILLLFLIVVILTKCDCYNLSPRSAIVVTDPTNQNGSYFGYSVTLRSMSKTGSTLPSIIIGAPKANSQYHKLTRNPGAIFQCDISPEGATVCKDMDLVIEDRKDGKFKYQENRAGSFLGATIVASDDTDDVFVACAPLWAQSNENDSYVNGRCYWKYNTKDIKSKGHQLTPLRDERKQLKSKRFWFGYGEAGMSAKIIGSKRNYELFLGAPGLHNWKGGVVKLFSTYREFSKSIVYYNISHRDISETSYFGYAVDAGVFLSKSKDISYVTSAPRNETGKVLIYDLPKTVDKELIVHKLFLGKEVGEYFGASLCALDFTGDDLDDLLIGAPQHGEDQGKVYVFVNKNEYTFEEQSALIHENQPGARFGTAINYLGDLNNDRFKDVVVGAPYEDEGNGAVYIYLGNSQRLGPKYSQRIAAKDVYINLRGFGFSLSRGVDMDGNEVPDLAIGSYASNHAVLLRSHTVATLQGRVETLQSKIGLKDKVLQIKACVTYKGYNKDQKVVLELILDSILRRAEVEMKTFRKSYEVDAINNKETCIPISLNIVSKLEPYRPLIIRLNYKLSKDFMQEKNFCASCPVIDPLEKNITSISVPFATGCADDDICRTDLKFDIRTLNKKLIRGQIDKKGIQLKATIKNDGEPAFETQLNMNLPKEMEIKLLPTECQRVEHKTALVLNCELGKLVNKTEEKSIDFDFDIRHIPINQKILTISTSVSALGKNKVPLKENIIELRLFIDAELHLSGKSYPEQLKRNISDEEEKVNNMKYKHSFNLENIGQSTLELALIKFKLPVGIKMKESNIMLIGVEEPMAYLNKEPIVCKSTSIGFITTIVDDMSDEEEVKSESTTEKEVNRNINDLISKLEKEKLANDDKDNLFSAKNTLYLNCSEESLDVLCMEVTCEVNHLQSNSLGATFEINFTPFVPVLDKIFQMKNVIEISTEATAEPLVDVIKKNTPFVTVKTVIFRINMKEEVSYWIYIASAVIGLIILLAIIGGFWKLGFFKRAKKETLKSLIQQMELDDTRQELDTKDVSGSKSKAK